jgi:hypothetical protein
LRRKLSHVAITVAISSGMPLRCLLAVLQETFQSQKPLILLALGGLPQFRPQLPHRRFCFVRIAAIT